MNALYPPVRDNSFTTGLLTIHSAPSALRSHIEWGLQSILGNWITLDWKVQPHFSGTYRTTIEFKDRAGTAAKVATALRNWHYLKFEVREESANGGEYFRFTPELGIHRADIDGLGSIVVSEVHVANALAKSFDEESLRFELEKILGKPWEFELEPLRNIEIEEVLRLKAI
jgi:hypothetical protein